MVSRSDKSHYHIYATYICNLCRLFDHEDPMMFRHYFEQIFVYEIILSCDLLNNSKNLHAEYENTVNKLAFFIQICM